MRIELPTSNRPELRGSLYAFVGMHTLQKGTANWLPYRPEDMVGFFSLLLLSGSLPFETIYSILICDQIHFCSRHLPAGPDGMEDEPVSLSVEFMEDA